MIANKKAAVLRCIYLLTAAALTAVTVFALFPGPPAPEPAAAPFFDVYEEAGSSVPATEGAGEAGPKKKYIKWVEFTPGYSALEKALDADIKSRREGCEVQISWIDLLSYLASKYGGDFSRYKAKDMDALIKKLEDGKTIEELTEKMEYFPFYHEAYTAILAEFVGEYSVEKPDPDSGEKQWVTTYGLKAFSPIAKGYGYSHYKDFGDGRSYGYKRCHQGHDLLGSIGTPIIAIESGVVETMGWNQYGGWRLGIRSFDGRRYYYYAHLRKGHPYHRELKEGDVVRAGDVIGYLGMTGYSAREDTNNMTAPHLHLGLQLIFDESQKEGVNQIWIDLYNLVTLLEKHRSAVYKVEEYKTYYRKYAFTDPTAEEYLKAHPNLTAPQASPPGSFLPEEFKSASSAAPQTVPSAG